MGEAGGIGFGFTDDFSFMVTVAGGSCVFDMLGYPQDCV